MQQLIDIFAALKDTGITEDQFMCAGGFPRDIHHGVQPKDIDIVVLGGTEHCGDVFDAMLRLGYHMTDDSAPSDNSSDASTRWAYIAQYARRGMEGLVGLEVDILFAHEKYKSLQEVVQDFDYNINMAAIFFPNRAIAGPLYFVQGTGHERVLRQTRHAHICPERAEHIREKARALGWTIPEEAQA